MVVGKRFLISFLILIISPFTLLSNDGSQLWLPNVDLDHTNTTIEIARAEVTGIDNVVVGDSKSKQVRGLISSGELKALGNEDYIIRKVGGKLVVAGGSDIGALYGAYHLQRLWLTEEIDNDINITHSPAYKLRLLNHWDNLDRTVERGYAGYSIWMWDELPNVISPRYVEYARANASIGINGAVLNNVNASPQILTAEYLQKVKVIADIFRPYGIRVYLSANFATPKALGELPDADPLDSRVVKWWKEKANEIYKLIPDFGGFLVKANSEGQPGPHDYGRSHSDGANLIADALKPHGGVVMWRAFVYSPDDADRAKQAYNEFVPLDGEFRDNVIVQIKNGPVDFQPREPFSPLFGAMPNTPVMAELQITQEYLGFSNHLAYLAPLFKECLDSDTFSNGVGSTVAKITDSTLRPFEYSAIAGVANIGEEANWTGHHFAQANWYCFGRLAWDHTLSSEQIAKEWLMMTFTRDEDFVNPMLEMMLSSREAVVDYMMPLGLHHIFAWNHHYGPEPWCEVEGARPDWLPKYYHRADSVGIGFDRTTKGSNAVSQYFAPLDSIFNNIETCPENLILWFHHVEWNHRMKSGLTLWDELCTHYDRGVKKVREMQKKWDKIEPYIDSERFAHVQSKLRIQSRDAVWWKDACLLYFQTFSQMPIPYNIERPVHDLDDLKKIKLDMIHHN